MARTQKLHLKDLKTSRSSLKPLRQILVLVLTVIMGVLISVSCNAQKTSEKKKLPYKTKNRAKANHYAQQAEPAAVNKTLLLSSILEKQIISEMVAQNLKERQDSHIELAPLLFNIKDGKLTAVDVNPLLIAIEFGIQGKTILIESFGMQHLPLQQQLRYTDVKEIVALMNEMGVPQERVSIVACNSDLKGSHKARIDFTAI